ncbi:hypothetical protein ACOTVD_03235 [Campylobacter jejuni]|uniref:hypothetical protein n=1 Tax=Campylobacter jejuni TaxID=197 RepID=UPI003B9CB7C8
MPIYDILQFYGIRGARVGATDYQCNIKDKKIVCDIKNFFVGDEIFILAYTENLRIIYSNFKEDFGKINVYAKDIQIGNILKNTLNKHQKNNNFIKLALQKYSLNYEGKIQGAKFNSQLNIVSKDLEFNANLNNISQKEFENVFKYVKECGFGIFISSTFEILKKYKKELHCKSQICREIEKDFYFM